MKYYIIAGEASGDLHASNLMKELKKEDAKAEFRCWGGDLMQKQGGTLVKHFKDLAFMGFYEVFMNIRTIARNIKFCKQDILNYQPDVVILVDYPGFNLRIAEFAHNEGFKVFYYISPKIWAWKKSRAFKIKKFVDKMFVIFPFEIDFYKKYDYQVEYVGNPLLDALADKTSNLLNFNDFIKQEKLPNKPIIALVAGSRKQEINSILPEMLQVIEHFPDYQFIITGAPSMPMEFYSQLIDKYDVRVIFDKTYQILKVASAALVTSGTATLETALLDVPQAICYKTSPITYKIAKYFIKIRFISLPNIIMDEGIVKEFIQYNIATDLKNELHRILYDKDYHTLMLANYKRLHEKIGEAGASKRSAVKMVEIIQNK